MGNKFNQKTLESIYQFDALQNNSNIDNARQIMNRANAMVFLMIGVTPEGNFSIHTQLQEKDLGQLLEKVIKILPDGKAVIQM